MKKNAFTLIELLAVIVILAIIALIAVPIVIHIINDSKNSGEEQSLELYRDSVQKAIANYQMTHPSFNPTECKIQDSGDIKCGTTDIKVEMKGTKPNSGKIIIENNKVTLKNIEIDGKIYYKSFATLISDADNDGEISIGDKYTYDVNKTDTFNFYVLSIEGTGSNQKVNLIMDRNICNDGGISYTSTNNYCTYKWYISAQNNTYGPVTAMQELYAGTKNWTNVPDMIMNYTDENNTDDNEKGYISIITDSNTKITTITGKPTTNIATIGTSREPLKARLPKESEVTGAGCLTTMAGSCPTWLMENMTYINRANDKYSINNNNEVYQNHIYGYWIMSSSSFGLNYAQFIYYNGALYDNDATNHDDYGIRPVITVPLSDLSN